MKFGTHILRQSAHKVSEGRIPAVGISHIFAQKTKKKYFSRFSVEKSFSYDFAQTFTVTSKKSVLYPQFFSRGFYV